MSSVVSIQNPEIFERMTQTIEIAVGWWVSQIQSSQNVTKEMSSRFEKFFFDSIVTKFEGHWFPSKPMKGQGYRSIVLDKKAPIDPLLLKAAKFSGISNLFECFPYVESIVMWIDPGEVAVKTFWAYSQGGKEEVIFKQKETPPKKPQSSIQQTNPQKVIPHNPPKSNFEERTPPPLQQQQQTEQQIKTPPQQTTPKKTPPPTPPKSQSKVFGYPQPPLQQQQQQQPPPPYQLQFSQHQHQYHYPQPIQQQHPPPYQNSFIYPDFGPLYHPQSPHLWQNDFRLSDPSHKGHKSDQNQNNWQKVYYNVDCWDSGVPLEAQA